MFWELCLRGVTSGPHVTGDPVFAAFLSRRPPPRQAGPAASSTANIAGEEVSEAMTGTTSRCNGRRRLGLVNVPHWFKAAMHL
jgi:hypothetical protein